MDDEVHVEAYADQQNNRTSCAMSWHCRSCSLLSRWSQFMLLFCSNTLQ